MIYQKKNSEGINYFECIRYSDFNIHAHMHRHPEILFVRRGSIVIESAVGKELISENELAFIMSNEMHSYSTHSDSLVDICIFSFDCVPAAADRFHGDDLCGFVAFPTVDVRSRWFVGRSRTQDDET